MSDNVQTIRDMAVQGIGQIDLVLAGGESATAFLQPDNAKLISLEQFQQKPNQIREHIELESIESFCEYVEKFKNESSIVKMVPSNFYKIMFGAESIEMSTAFINYHSPHFPAWLYHKASLVAYASKEFLRWMERDRERFSQLKFAQFLTDNTDVIAEPDLATLVASVSRYRVRESGDTFSVVEKQNSKTESRYELQGDDLPEFLTLSIKPLRFFNYYSINARLIVEISENQKPVFSYQLINIDKVINHIIDDAKKTITEKTGINPFL